MIAILKGSKWVVPQHAWHNSFDGRVPSPDAYVGEGLVVQNGCIFLHGTYIASHLGKHCLIILAVGLRVGHW